MAKETVPTNVYGIVIPPSAEECLGDDCKYRGAQETCELTRHHLHSTENLYQRSGRQAWAFRNMAILTVWMHRCRHDIHHLGHQHEVPVPSLDIMRGCLEEFRILRKLSSSQNELAGIERSLVAPSLREEEIEGRQRVRERIIAAHENLVGRVKEIEVLPEELVTGALIITVPDVARERILAGAGFVFTGTMRKDNVQTANRFVSTLLGGDAEPLQTGLNGVELAA